MTAEDGAIDPGALRVLLVEDSILDEVIITEQLRAGGLSHQIQRVQTRSQFLSALEAWRADVILSDYNVPGFGGEEALLLTREHQPSTPFLFVSGALGEHAAVELLKKGATDYILKDRLERLVPSVERALRESTEKSVRLEAERKLLERERTLSNLMRNLPGMAFRCRMISPWRLDFASEGCLALTGYPPEAFAPGGDQTFDAIIHPDDVGRITRESWAAIEAQTQLDTRYRIRHRDGGERWAWVRAVIHPAADGPPVMEGFVTDITAQKAAEAEVSRRITFEQQLIGIVSHDLKNPLHAIQLGATILSQRAAADATSASVVRRMLASTERAGRMINDLLDFTQVRLGGGIPVVPQAADLRALAAQVLEEFDQSHPDRRVELTGPTPLEATLDPGRIAQTITNLVQNALTYSPKDTVVTVRLGVEGDLATIEVHNRGAPIPPDRLGDVFEPLHRGDVAAGSRSRSIGLGLFIVASIARAHGGDVAVRSTAEEGTTFIVFIPRSPTRKASP